MRALKLSHQDRGHEKPNWESKKVLEGEVSGLDWDGISSRYAGEVGAAASERAAFQSISAAFSFAGEGVCARYR